MRKRRDVVVIGGGIAGLAAAAERIAPALGGLPGLRAEVIDSGSLWYVEALLIFSILYALWWTFSGRRAGQVRRRRSPPKRDWSCASPISGPSATIGRSSPYRAHN